MLERSRTAPHAQVSQALALLSDAQLLALADGAQQLATGIGGTTLSFHVEGIRVFAKRVRLSRLERQPEHHRSTANLFALPAFCQRNVGSVGMGVWRELAAQLLTTEWVLSHQLPNFPLTCHWRVLEGAASPQAAPALPEWADLERMVQHWQGSAAMRQRLQALADAPASVLIVMEHLPWNLNDWLDAQWAIGPEATEHSCTVVEHGLLVDLPQMNSLGLLHGDTHLGNILTDGQRLYFADLGLATSAAFDLSAEEQAYMQQHASLDQAQAVSRWIKWLLKAWGPEGSSAQRRMEMLRAVAQGQSCQELFPRLPQRVSRIVERHAEVSTLVTDFYVQLLSRSTSAPYPQAAIEAALKASRD